MLALLAACGEEGHAAFIEPAHGDACRFAECAGHGVCADEGDGPICACDEGYDGDRCEDCAARFHRDSRQLCVSDQYCARQDGDPCGEHGSCTDEAGVIGCACDRGYEGARCELCSSGYGRNDFGECLELLLVNGEEQLPPELCTPASCHGHGQCARVDGSLSCSCFPGYSGVRCDLCSPGYGLQGDRCVLKVDCPASECGACDRFEPGSDFPIYADTCVSREAVELTDLTLTSLDGEGTVWLCAATTRYGMSTEHIVLEVGAARSAKLAFRDPVAELSLDLAAGVFGSDDTLSLELLGDGVMHETFELERGKTGPLSFSFDPPIETFALRSPGATTEVAIDNLVYELAMCR